MASLRLVPVSGPGIDVVKDPSVVGRDPSCEIVVADGSVSRRHARLERRELAWWVVDQGSANGTYLNSQRVAEQALKPGQELRFGALSYRVELKEDPEATVATPLRVDESATVMAMPEPTPPGRPAPPPPLPKPGSPPPLPPAAPPSAAAARERFKGAAAGGSAAPVPQMPSGPAPMKKGKSPLVWIGVGCCGCLLLVGLVAAAIFGGTYMATKGPADAAHAWIVELRQGQTQEAQAAMSDGYKSRADAEELERLSQAIAHSKDATFPMRSVENDRATLTGVLTGGGAPQPIVIHLVKEGGGWKVDRVTLGTE
jgi:hypothetical protein